MRPCAGMDSYSLNVPREMGGEGVGLLNYSLAAEELAQGCPATALSFNMHLSIIGPLFESPIVPPATKQRLADLVVKEQRLIAGNFSEPRTSGLLAHLSTGYACPTGCGRLPDHGQKGVCFHVGGG